MFSRKLFSTIGLGLIIGGVTVLGACTGSAAEALQPPTTLQTATLPLEPAARITTPLDKSEFQAAVEAINAGQSDVARRILMHLLQRDPGNCGALDRLAQASIAYANDLARLDEQVQAVEVLGQARSFLEAAQSTLNDDTDPATLISLLLKLDTELDAAHSRISTDVESTAKKAIAKADWWAVDAHYKWYTLQFNNRDAVRSGVRQLRWVRERFDLLGADMQGEYQRSMQNLKSLVSDQEWDPMLASAGFVTKDVQAQISPTQLAEK